MVNKKKTVMLLVIVFTMLISSLAYTAGDTVAAYVPNVKQAKSNQCWCASGVAFLGNRGITTNQNTFSTRVKGNSTNNSTASSVEVRNGIATYGITTTISGPRTRSNVRSSLTTGKAIIAGYGGVGVGHMVVISGHENTSDMLEVMDPASGSKKYYKFTYFTSNASWRWLESIY